MVRPPWILLSYFTDHASGKQCATSRVQGTEPKSVAQSTAKSSAERAVQAPPQAPGSPMCFSKLLQVKRRNTGCKFQFRQVKQRKSILGRLRILENLTSAWTALSLNCALLQPTLTCRTSKNQPNWSICKWLNYIPRQTHTQSEAFGAQWKCTTLARPTPRRVTGNKANTWLSQKPEQDTKTAQVHYICLK